MGRPLYSKAFSTEPVVREPEPSCPYEKWSYVNAFDPDSDEFFENDQAVYEAFVDRVAAEQSEEEDDVEESDMVVIRMGNASPISSEDSLSDRDSPMAVGADDPAQYIAEVYRRRRAEVEAPARVNLATRGIPGDLQGATPVVGETSVGSVVATSSRENVETPVQQPTSHLAPPSSAPIPVPRTHRSASVEDFTIPSFYHQSSPMTPSRHSAFSRFSPSPPLTVSPRIYTWASRRPTYPSTSTSPFTNTNARLSHAHLSPSLVRVHGLMT